MVLKISIASYQVCVWLDSLSLRTKLYRHKKTYMKIKCPRSLFSVDKGLEGGSKSHYKRVIECCLGSFVIFQGIRSSNAKKPYIFVIFQGGPDPLTPPSGSAHVGNDVNHLFLGNVLIRLDSWFYRQAVEIPIGAYCAPFVVDLFSLTLTIFDLKILKHLTRAVEIPCPTCRTRSHFI